MRGMEKQKGDWVEKGGGDGWDYVAETMINLLLGNPFSHLWWQIYFWRKICRGTCPKTMLALCTPKPCHFFAF